MTLTPRQLDVLRTVERFRAVHGYSPSVREVCDGCGLTSTASAHRHLEALRDAGMLTWQRGKTRTIVAHPRQG